jgi:hypothetical protein|tara:strand:+ start:387 stop:1061 length:675 start_codon:yes stop_codon:yes gene_type:complete
MTLRGTPIKFPPRANRLVTAPTVEPVTADELRTQLREGATGLPDLEANDLIEISRQWVEDKISVSFIDQTWKLTLDHWPNNGKTPWWDGIKTGSMAELHNPIGAIVSPPRWPMTSVESLTTYDTDGTPTVLVVANTLDVDAASIPARIQLKRDVSLPSNNRLFASIEIVYISGYGATGAFVPAPMKRAILQVAAGLYTHRGDGCDAVADTMTKDLIETYRLGRI